MLKVLLVPFKDLQTKAAKAVGKNPKHFGSDQNRSRNEQSNTPSMSLRAEKSIFCRVQSHYLVRFCPQRGWDYAPSGTVPETLGHQDRSTLGWLVGADKTHVLVPNHRYTHVHTPSVIKKKKKNMITNTVELITFLATSYMSAHAEHLCPPPFIVLSRLILFSSEMIVISLAAKYECKFISLVPAKTLSVYWSVIIVRRQTGKEHF